MIIYVDIDGVLCEDVNANYEKAKPYKEAIEKLNKLYEAGHQIILWTARGTETGMDWSELTENQLKLWGVKYHQLIFEKPNYDIFIDDKTVSSIFKIDA